LNRVVFPEFGLPARAMVLMGEIVAEGECSVMNRSERNLDQVGFFFAQR